MDCCISRDSMTLGRASGNRCCNCKGNCSFPCVRLAEVGPARTGRHRWLSIVLLLTLAFSGRSLRKKNRHKRLYRLALLPPAFRRRLVLVEIGKAVEAACFETC